MRRFTYSRWDGTQVGFEFDADDIFGELTDELLYHGDLNQALHRLMQRGFQQADNASQQLTMSQCMALAGVASFTGVAGAAVLRALRQITPEQLVKRIFDQVKVP